MGVHSVDDNKKKPIAIKNKVHSSRALSATIFLQ